MIWVFLILFGAYFICIIALIYGFKKVQCFSLEATEASTCFSVVIPFRNEAENLPELLKSISELNYPARLFEIIFVNDASEDSSESIISEAIKKSDYSIKLIQNKRSSNSPKKDAISEAIANSKFDWIITTDADCKLPPNWLKTIDLFIRANNPEMVCGPVKYESNGSFIENFQELDGLSLQMVSIGSFGLQNPILSNGANLAYTKQSFLSVNGFSGNDHIASGDDIFLLEKMKNEFPEKVHFLKSKEAIVITKPQKTWKKVLNQRIRWASKSSKQKSAASLLLGALVLLVSISILVLPFFMIFNSENITLFTLLIVSKLITDFIFVRQAGDFFNTKISFWRFPLQLFLYAVIVFLVVLGSFRGTYLWKGRSFKKP